MDEYVLLGNAALMRCHIPSFVTDFVRVDQWVTADGRAIDGTGISPSRSPGSSATQTLIVNWLEMTSLWILNQSQFVEWGPYPPVGPLQYQYPETREKNIFLSDRGLSCFQSPKNIDQSSCGLFIS